GSLFVRGLGRLATSVTFVRTALALLSSPFSRSARRRLGGRSFGCGFRKAFARFDRRGIGSDVPDQPIPLRTGNQSLMHELGKLPLGEFGKGAGESRFVRHLASRFPTADAPQLLIVLQPFQQLPGEAETVDCFGHKRRTLQLSDPSTAVRSSLARPVQTGPAEPFPRWPPIAWRCCPVHRSLPPTPGIAESAECGRIV